jgi:hypothetical protein
VTSSASGATSGEAGRDVSPSDLQVGHSPSIDSTSSGCAQRRQELGVGTGLPPGSFDRTTSRDVNHSTGRAQGTCGRRAGIAGLRQLRKLAKEFSASAKYRNSTDDTELRLLPQPIHSYAAPKQGVLNGGLFAFVR